ncbi:alpha/beta hydrolase [Leifsonia sp. AG29]|uniref:alpha/beta hydrolase n=1 Tax=Leifsonia sp. AG29 TaxID=2598860 RepID=UPI00131A6557|nr:alpha/beta hydrolase [Leifsonia sp. AG29]
MSLIYDARDSKRVIDALSANLDSAASVLAQLELARRHLDSVLGTGELSGQAYSAVGLLFTEVIGPCIQDAKSQIDKTREDLEKYEWEDSKVSRFGVLNEDALAVQLSATRRQRDATERLIEVNREAATALAAYPAMGDAVRLINRGLEVVLEGLEKDIRDLDDRLAALEAFAVGTRGLFKTDFSTGMTRSLVTALRSSSSSLTANASPDANVSQLMSLLALFGPEQVELLLNRNPELAQLFWDNPPSAEAVATWWKALSPDAREKWCQAAPTIIGNLPGLDADTRIHANTIQLKRDLYDGSIDPNSPRGILLRDILKALDVEKYSGPALDYERLAKEGKTPRGLLAYNSTRTPPLAAVAIAETSAEKSGKVTWAVPGMNSGLGEPGRLAGWTNAAAKLHKAQNELEPGVPHLVVAWIGYAPPTLDQSVIQGDHARAGAARLTKELDGQWAASSIVSGNPHPFTAVVGHSYGTTVATNAVNGNGPLSRNVQSVVLLASAGVERSIPTADSLAVDGGAGRVYASQSSRDEVADAGRDLSRRGDPRDGSFGAKVFSSDGDTAQLYQPTDGHDAIGYGKDRGGPWIFAHATAGHGYLDAGTEALKNTAAAALGLDHEINGGTWQGNNR